MFDLSQLDDALRAERGVSRRLFLGTMAALAALPYQAQRCQAAARRVRLASYPFTLGVASGDPDSSSVVLWTRLAPQLLEPHGGMSDEMVPVKWEVADDEHFSKIVREGTTTAAPAFGHSVHVEVPGLKPDSWYFYRFHAGDETSPVGRTRTLPAADVMPAELRFAFASCQHYEYGLFTAYEQAARDDLDLMFHLGDYIYEYGGKDNLVRKHHGTEIKSLTDYRVRHAQYKSDPLLQAVHGQCPWFVTWDDHEFDNNCAGAISEEKGVSPEEFLKRRANAYQAYYEAMPLRPFSVPKGPDMQLYRKASFGRLAELLVLDTRQYRSDQPNGDKASPLNEAALDPKQSLLGTTQRAWLQDSLVQSTGIWNVLAQQVMMGMAQRVKDGQPGVFSMDQWPGCAHERMALLKFMAERKINNPVVLTGDIHSNWANELRVDDRQLETPLVATEFVATSISSGGNGRANPTYLDALQSDNPFVKFHNTERGYVRCRVTQQTWTTNFVGVEDVLKPGGKIVERATFVVEAGNPQLHAG